VAHATIYAHLTHLPQLLPEADDIFSLLEDSQLSSKVVLVRPSRASSSNTDAYTLLLSDVEHTRASQTPLG
jgi:hypothetical protein